MLEPEIFRNSCLNPFPVILPEIRQVRIAISHRVTYYPGRFVIRLGVRQDVPLRAGRRAPGPKLRRPSAGRNRVMPLYEGVVRSISCDNRELHQSISTDGFCRKLFPVEGASGSSGRGGGNIGFCNRFGIVVMWMIGAT